VFLSSAPTAKTVGGLPQKMGLVETAGSAICLLVLDDAHHGIIAAQVDVAVI